MIKKAYSLWQVATLPLQRLQASLKIEECGLFVNHELI